MPLNVAPTCARRYPSRPMPKPSIIRIELTDPAKAALARLSDRHEMTQTSMMSRLVEFFASQDDMVKSVMVGRYPEAIEAEVAKLILQRTR